MIVKPAWRVRLACGRCCNIICGGLASYSEALAAARERFGDRALDVE